MFIPQEWDEDLERRAKARVPEEVRHEPKWQLALEMIDELRAWGPQAPVSLADAGHGEITEFRCGLEECGLDYVVQAATSAFCERERPEVSPYAGTGRPPRPRYREKPASLKALALAAGARRARQVSWREGTRGKLRMRFLALRVRPANSKLRRAAGAGELPAALAYRRVADRCSGAGQVLALDLPADTPLERLVHLAKLRWRIEHDYRELKDALGLDHFEGRSYPGWHHHTTLVSTAHAFLTLERTRRRQPRAAA